MFDEFGFGRGSNPINTPPKDPVQEKPTNNLNLFGISVPNPLNVANDLVGGAVKGTQDLAGGAWNDLGNTARSLGDSIFGKGSSEKGLVNQIAGGIGGFQANLFSGAIGGIAKNLGIDPKILLIGGGILAIIVGIVLLKVLV